MADRINEAAGSPIPLRLSGDVNHPWFHPYWSVRVIVTLAGERITGVLHADTVAGWAEVYAQPLRPVGDTFATYQFRGEVKFIPTPEAEIDAE